MYFFSIPDVSDFFSTLPEEVKEDVKSKLPERKALALSRLSESLPRIFDLSYIEHAIVPSFVTSFYQGEKLSLPMLDEERFSKEKRPTVLLVGTVI